MFKLARLLSNLAPAASVCKSKSFYIEWHVAVFCRLETVILRFSMKSRVKREARLLKKTKQKSKGSESFEVEAREGTLFWSVSLGAKSLDCNSRGSKYCVSRDLERKVTRAKVSTSELRWKLGNRPEEKGGNGEGRAPPDPSPKAIYYAEVAFSKEAMLTVN